MLTPAQCIAKAESCEALAMAYRTKSRELLMNIARQWRELAKETAGDEISNYGRKTKSGCDQ
jgi:hypothetical protein